jgi:hypothetical protein
MAEPITMWVIYYNPLDYPGQYVMREWYILPNRTLSPALACEVCKTLDQARRFVPWGKFNVGRYEFDDPAIYEVWI